MHFTARLLRRTASLTPFILLFTLSAPVHDAAASQEARMVMTVLEARVPAAHLAETEKLFREGMSSLPPEIVESFLVRDTKDDALFRLTTVWRSMEDLQAMRASGVKPKGVQMFEAVGATPTLSIWGVTVHSHR